jgi:hypothetical protein
MAYRVELGLNAATAQRFAQAREAADQFFVPLVRDALDILQGYAVQNLSGVPFTSQTGTHVIQKRTGRAAASVQVQAPYGSPYRGRLFASAKTKYADNPETYDYLSILEYGRGEVRPKYTPSAKAGFTSRARLAIPGGPHQLVTGEGGFRGVSGRYRFVKRLPPMAGKYWMQAAAEAAAPDIEDRVNRRVDEFLQQL